MDSKQTASGNYSGSRWYKCDLHLHTMTSSCYSDKTDTPELWVARAKEQGLSVAAVTDHNDYRGIREIMEEGKKQNLVIFPGVEITCDSSKIHMLILFDTSKNEETVRDFLNRCDIDSEVIGDTDGTALSVTEVCQIAKKRGALVIAAHIDEFSSISSMNPANLDRLLTSGLIDAVQVANVPVWEKFQQDKDAAGMYAYMREKYGPDANPETVERFRKCYDRALEAGLPVLAFSDNPESEDSGKHGLWGIGSVYTWIQMDNIVSLESLRQALISPANRIRTIFDSPEEPKSEPDFWIQSLEIRKSLLNPHQPIHLDFHPQLNCIIGGRGSGKSAIVMILKGAYKQFLGAESDSHIQAQRLLYSRDDGSGHGIFQENSEIEIYFSWFGCRYRMLITDIHDADHQNYSFYRINPEDGTEIREVSWDDLHFRSFMNAQVFAHREINEISRSSDELLAYIDSLIKDMYILQAKKRYYMNKLVHCSEEAEAEKQLISNDYRVIAELQWLRSLGENHDLPAVIREEYPQMLSRRVQTSEMIDLGVEHLFGIKEEQEKLLKSYEDTLAEIRELRTQFIARVLKDDDNYKIEIKPMADVESLHRVLQQYLGVDITLIREDVKKLEEALFTKKGSLMKYQSLILQAKKQAEEEKTAGKKLSGKEDAAEGSVFSDYFVHRIGELSTADFEYLRLFHPEDLLCLFYHPTGVKRYFPMENASAGEKATAMFSFFLQSRTSPLVIDQPETDMDNHVIYAEILNKIKKEKQNRQLILATHNPILTTNTDAGMIITMDAGSRFVRVKTQGTVDNNEIRREICEIIEGSEYAFRQRAKKYNI